MISTLSKFILIDFGVQLNFLRNRRLKYVMLANPVSSCIIMASVRDFNLLIVPANSGIATKRLSSVHVSKNTLMLVILPSASVWLWSNYQT